MNRAYVLWISVPLCLAACGGTVSASSATVSAVPAETAGPKEAGRPRLSQCFPNTLGGLPLLGAPAMPGLGDGLFARAYIQRGSARAINVNVWELDDSNRGSYLAQHPVLGRDGEVRSAPQIERQGCLHRGQPCERSWEELLTGGRRDTFVVLVAPSRLLSLNVQPDAQRGDAERLFSELDWACLQTARL